MLPQRLADDLASSACVGNICHHIRLNFFFRGLSHLSLVDWGLTKTKRAGVPFGPPLFYFGINTEYNISMPLDWRLKRQFFYIGIFSLIPIAIVVYFVFRVVPDATCFDNKKNQGEEKVDCGGPCAPCLENLSEPVILWTRLFKLADGLYEVATLIENTHNFAASDRFFYRMKIYNEDNILIGLKEGETFINPNEKFLVLDPTFTTGERIPVRALVEFDQFKWRYAEHTPPNVVVVSRDFSLEPQPHLSAILRNNDIFAVSNIQAAVILSDDAGKVIGASLTNIDKIEGQSDKTISFSWPKTALEGEPKNIEILVRRYNPAVRP